ncbi:hypothetical protein BDW42DRAFT_21154 [Aspergillus taichungensis]|uniref:Uncharacterized protein n=1 Tax=Aspergillus taichungensis TaxID=482145 RepID=A0A2J5HHA4_9EURO|nr:hypothetical protein BDW42DRAFT_21154 [Aspergillus taichungensis]
MPARTPRERSLKPSVPSSSLPFCRCSFLCFLHSMHPPHLAFLCPASNPSRQDKTYTSRKDPSSTTELVRFYTHP